MMNKKFNVTGMTCASCSSHVEKSVAKLCAMGLINGFEDKTFRPNDAATRAQAAAVIYNYLYLEK